MILFGEPENRIQEILSFLDPNNKNDIYIKGAAYKKNNEVII
jgi:hypothetical protein